MSSRTRDYPSGERVPGTVYQVNRVIGAGGMGTVYDVEDTTIGKRYVLKTLHPQLGAREDLARRMQNEARTLARLHHPNIVEVITAGVTGDELRLPYYVMERLDGKSLRYVLDKSGQLELLHAYHIAIDLLEALDHAHDKGVIHRDVKPDNIFLHRTSAGVTVTKLLDFGIVSLLDAGTRETAGRFLGTLRYAAPEQLHGEKATPKMDIYAAALVLYEMVAGRGPFDDEGDAHKVAAAHIQKPAPPLSHFVVVPKALDVLVSAALSKVPEQRPRDAFSFAGSIRNLKKALGGAPAIDSTENRATAAAIVRGEPGAPYVHVQQSTPDGPYVISPVSWQTPSGNTQPMAGPQTTQQGMNTPPLGHSLAGPADLVPTATSGESVDRRAVTRSYVPNPSPAPQHGTGVMPPLGPTATLPMEPPSPPQSPQAPFRWPSEGRAERSDEPQVRTLSGSGPGRTRAAGPILVAVLVLLLAALSVSIVVVRMRSSREAAGQKAQALTVTTATATQVPPAAIDSVVPMPAPTLSPPALDDLPTPKSSAGSAGPSPGPAPAPGPARAPAAKTAKPLPKPVPVKPAAVASDPTRPGPGF